MAKIIIYKDEKFIKKQVSKWSFKDCKEYLEKHKKDSKPIELTRKNIVEDRAKELIGSMKLIDTENYYKNNKIENLEDDLHKHLLETSKSSAPADRKKAFGNWDLSEIQMNFSDIIPKKYQDSNYEGWKPDNEDTGLYLWANGYNVIRPIAFGGFGCVWECEGNKAVKVVPNGDSAKIESESIKDLTKVIAKSDEKQKVR